MGILKIAQALEPDRAVDYGRRAPGLKNKCGSSDPISTSATWKFQGPTGTFNFSATNAVHHTCETHYLRATYRSNVAPGLGNSVAI